MLSLQTVAYLLGC